MKQIVYGTVVCSRLPLLVLILFSEASHSIYSDGVRFSKVSVSRCFDNSPLTPPSTVDRSLYRGLYEMSEECKIEQKLFYTYISVYKYTFI